MSSRDAPLYLKRCTYALTICNALAVAVFFASRHALRIFLPEVAGTQECAGARGRGGGPLVAVSGFHKSGIFLSRKLAGAACLRLDACCAFHPPDATRAQLAASAARPEVSVMFHYHPLLNEFAGPRRVVLWRDPRSKLLSTLAYHRRGVERWAVDAAALSRRAVAEDLCGALQLGARAPASSSFCTNSVGDPSRFFRRACRRFLSTDAAAERRAGEAVAAAARRALAARLTEEPRALAAVLRSSTVADGCVVAGAVAAFDTLEMALFVNATRRASGALLLKLDDVVADFSAAADALVAFFGSAGGRLARRARADAAGLRRSFLAFDLRGATLDAHQYRAFDRVVTRHSSSRRYERAAGRELRALLCGRGADRDLRAILAPAFALLGGDMCDAT